MLTKFNYTHNEINEENQLNSEENDAVRKKHMQILCCALLKVRSKRWKRHKLSCFVCFIPCVLYYYFFPFLFRCTMENGKKMATNFTGEFMHVDNDDDVEHVSSDKAQIRVILIKFILYDRHKKSFRPNLCRLLSFFMFQFRFGFFRYKFLHSIWRKKIHGSRICTTDIRMRV